MANALVSLESLHKSYGATPVLRGVDLSIEAGTFTAVLGPSGSGKTTLLRLLAGFERADQGRIELGGRVVDDTRRVVPPEKRRIGYVPQDGSLFPHLTVRANIGFGLPRAQRRGGRVDELLALTDLGTMADRYPHQLSGGQQQRVAIARALAIEPKVLLLDEPLSALDARVRAQLRVEIRNLQQRLQITTLFVTHDQSEALSMADRVGVMQAGRLEQLDTPENVYRRPATAFAAEFVGAMNRLPGRMGDSGDVQ
ncbi:MAG TPA: ABC transporter ATP-binding protein, partial [Actinospica sp.]|nr:ABC transporter ATP-binding protein [Actinospica sp.]